eukprot:1685382-Lingulodinium_polyedra.AAC.1
MEEEDEGRRPICVRGNRRPARKKCRNIWSAECRSGHGAHSASKERRRARPAGAGKMKDPSYQ